MCTDRAKLDRGCEKDARQGGWTDLDGVRQTRCPRRPIFEDPSFFSTLWSAYNGYQSGFLPRAGGLNDQHAMFSELMNIVYNTIERCDSVKKEQQAARDRVMEGL